MENMTDATKKKIIKWFWILFSVPVLLVFTLIGLVWALADIPSFEELENPDSNLATQVIADDGSTILSTFHIENRSYVTYDELSPNLVHAAVATEDVRFYTHSGIDFQSLGRVVFKTLLGGDSSQGGGSTITQQLAKTLYPRADVSSKIPGMSKLKMVWIKLKEWVTAVKLERSYTKDEIITMYLNQVFFGSNAYGIKSAAQTFFAKTPAALTIEEAATLVGMVNKPTRYNPALNPDKSIVRRNFVISQMAKEPKRSSYSQYEDYVVDSLLWADDELYGWINKNTKPDGTKYDIYRDGLRIYTTINPKMQRYAEEAVEKHIGGDMQKRFDREVRWKKNPPFDDEVEQKWIDGIMKRARKDSDRYRRMKAAGVSESEIMKSFSVKVPMTLFTWEGDRQVDTVMTPDDSIRYYKRHMRASFMAMTPDNGQIKAYVGGADFKAFQYDNARQSKRQIGSTIKPFLYTLAMQEGMSPCDQVANVPQTFIISEDKIWTPESTDKDEYIGNMVTLKWGLAKSSNNISAYLMKQYGPQAMVEMMRKMGVGSFLDPVPPLCVGAANISLYEMVAAYNSFPSKGMYVRPIFVTRIEDNMGNVLATFSTVKKEAVSDRTAYLMANLMQGVVNGGTGYALRSRFGLTGEMAGKTGTTNDNADGWFIGYTPQLTAGAWAGFEDMQVHFAALANGGGSASALPIWGYFMQSVRKDPSLSKYYDKEFFDAPSGFELNLNCDGDALAETSDKSADDSVYIDDEYEDEKETYGFE